MLALVGLLVFAARVAAPQGAIEDAARRAAAERLRPGDRIELQFRRDRDLSGAATVNERGEAVFPKLGTLMVSQMTIGELPDTLRNRYAEFLRSPEVEIVILRRVVVNGEVKVPGVYMLDLTSGVRDAIARAGGMLETAGRHKVTVMRGDRRLKVSHWDRGQGPENDVQSGDQVIVGRLSWLQINALPVISTSVIVIGLIRSIRQ